MGKQDPKCKALPDKYPKLERRIEGKPVGRIERSNISPALIREKVDQPFLRILGNLRTGFGKKRVEKVEDQRARELAHYHGHLTRNILGDRKT